MPTLSTSKRFVEALHVIASTSSLPEGIAAVHEQGTRLFGRLELRLALGAEPAGAAATTWPLVSRGRTIGYLHAARPPARHRRTQRRRLMAFADLAAVTLDNLAVLADRDARARRDPLTGLLNYREFHAALDALLGAPASPFVVVTLDLDRFKQVNDGAGHAAGDRVLRATASALAGVCRGSDSAFRIGGDEFALLLPGADREAGQRVARRAADAIARIAHRPGASFGVAAHDGAGTPPADLVSRADADLYRNKGRGRALAALDDDPSRTRLAVAARLATKLAPLDRPDAIAQVVVNELHSAFGFFLAVIQRLDADGVLRVVAAAGPLADSAAFLAHEQPVHQGVNGRVARTGRLAVIPDTSVDPDYLRRDPRSDPGSELSLPIVSDGAIWGVLNLEQVATNAFGDDDVLLADAVAAQVGAALHRTALTRELERSFATTLGVLADALETKDPYTAHHADQVAELALGTARELGLSDDDLEPVRYTALLHDIGKIGIDSELLRKPGRLTAEEFRQVQEHSAIGDAMLRRIPMLAHVAPLVRAVHERYDGGGYPDGLAGREIPLGARIVAACDALHAMTSDRPYRRARPLGAALAELRRCAGTQFDPEVVAALVRASRALETSRPAGRGSGGRRIRTFEGVAT